MPQDECDPSFEESALEDQRRVYAGGYIYPCPDCGAENALTREMKRRGYHCDNCTRSIEDF
jgi:DNA-directed RNA polymerase subunit RPC12/RpoP